MPTILPDQSRSQIENSDLTASGTTLLRFYAVAGLAVALLATSQMKAGMFDGLTTAESILKAVATEVPISEIAIVWARPLI